MRGRRFLRTGATGIVLALLFGGTASSFPVPELRSGGKSQRGHVVSTIWTTPADHGSCGTFIGDGPPGYPKPLTMRAGNHAVRLVYVHLRPEAVEIVTRATPSDGAPAKDLRARIVPGRSARGEVFTWEARFRVSPGRDHYLDVLSEWPERRNCPGAREVFQTFSLSAPAPTGARQLRAKPGPRGSGPATARGVPG